MASFSKARPNMFDGCNSSSWVTQMEHYIYLHGSTKGLQKLKVGDLYLEIEC